MTTTHPPGAAGAVDREPIVEGANPLGLDGVEFIEYATSKPQALGQVLEKMGFRPMSRHRSHEVLLYRQGELNVAFQTVCLRSQRDGLAHQGWCMGEMGPGRTHAGLPQARRLTSNRLDIG